MASVSISGDVSGAISIAAPSAAGSGVLTLPTGTDTLIGKATTDTLTNKTLTSPTITGATITVAATAAPAFSAYANVGTSLIGPAFTKVLYQVELYDTNNNFASSTFTPTVAGYYQINASVNVQGSTGETSIAIYKNGSIFSQGTDITASATYELTISRLVYFNGTTDYVDIYAYVPTTRTSGAAAHTMWFDGSMIRSA
jgi:hypothetical protein